MAGGERFTNNGIRQTGSEVWKRMLLGKKNLRQDVFTLPVIRMENVGASNGAAKQGRK